MAIEFVQGLSRLLGRGSPLAKDLGVVVAVLQSRVPPAKGWEYATAKERRERVSDIARALYDEAQSNVARAIELWSVECTPPEEDAHCPDQRQRRDAIEELAVKLTDAAGAFADAVADWEAHDPDDCEECAAARRDAAMARKGDDE